MTTFVSYLKGESGADLGELLQYMTQKELDADFMPFAAALAKAWVYEQHPELTQLSAGQITELGEKVSIAPLPMRAMDQVNEVFDTLADYKAQIVSGQAKVAELEETVAAKDAKIADLEKKVKEFESEKKGEAEQLFVTTEARVEEFTKKLEELLKEVDEVKKTGVVVAGVAAAAGAAPAAEAAASGAPAEEGAGDDFGFSGGGADPFAATDW
jgi:septal ring factor EnvC (AmiA/AmiB activator)